MLIVRTGQCTKWQRFQIKDNIKQIPYWQRDHVCSVIKGRYARDGGDKAIVNYALAKLGMNVELV
jgi:hypothetical protein